MVFRVQNVDSVRFLRPRSYPQNGLNGENLLKRDKKLFVRHVLKSISFEGVPSRNENSLPEQRLIFIGFCPRATRPWISRIHLRYTLYSNALISIISSSESHFSQFGISDLA